MVRYDAGVINSLWTVEELLAGRACVEDEWFVADKAEMDCLPSGGGLEAGTYEEVKILLLYDVLDCVEECVADLC